MRIQMLKWCSCERSPAASPARSDLISSPMNRLLYAVEGPVVGLLSHPAELATEGRLRFGRGTSPPPAPPSAPDVTALLRYVGGEMVVRGRLTNPWTLYAGDVRPEIWARTEELTDPTDRTLVAHLEGGSHLAVPVRHTAAGEAVGALREQGISVFLAGDHDALAAVVGRYLADSGFLRDPAELRPETERAAPPERLDPDAIWTGTGRGFALETADTTSPEAPIHEDLEVETT